VIELRDMQLLVALAQHQHFAKAAQDCGISQPAFSMRIRALEERLSTAIVRRGNRFLGFTAQGEVLVQRARGILEDAKALEQEMRAVDGPVSGNLTLGVVPTALGPAARLCAALQTEYPEILMRIESGSSIAIQQSIETGRLDAGLTYSDGVSGDMMRIDPVYQETYVLLAHASLVSSTATSITWTEAAELPLNLLDTQMQNRKILDKVFVDLGVRPKIVSQANVFTPALTMVRQGVGATIVPQGLVETLGAFQDIRILPLTEPEVTKSISLIAALRGPALPVVQALRDVALRLHDN
jgi:DNA-binding transcriptional LysR family regulator